MTTFGTRTYTHDTQKGAMKALLKCAWKLQCEESVAFRQVTIQNAMLHIRLKISDLIRTHSSIMGKKVLILAVLVLR